MTRSRSPQRRNPSNSSQSLAARIELQCLTGGTVHDFAAQGDFVIAASLPVAELVPVMGTAGVAGLALAVDGQKCGNGGGEIGDQAITRAAGGREVRRAAGVADRHHVPPHCFVPVIEKLTEVTARGEDMFQWHAVQA